MGSHDSQRSEEQIGSSQRVAKLARNRHEIFSHTHAHAHTDTHLASNFSSAGTSAYGRTIFLISEIYCFIYLSLLVKHFDLFFFLLDQISSIIAFLLN